MKKNKKKKTSKKKKTLKKSVFSSTEMLQGLNQTKQPVLELRANANEALIAAWPILEAQREAVFTPSTRLSVPQTPPLSTAGFLGEALPPQCDKVHL